MNAIHKTFKANFDRHTYKKPTICWVLGHIDIEGNKRSDIEAKKAAR